MPLSSSATRKRMHQRGVSYEGFARDDGLFDLEGHLVDVKDHDIELLSGPRLRGTPIHDMWARLTIDREFTVHAVEVAMAAFPYPDGCDRIAGAYQQLVGANLMQGFRRRLQDAVGGVQGCTHVTEMIGWMPTAAAQMLSGLQRREDDGEHKPFQLDRCHALVTTGEVVRRYYPRWHRGA